VKYSINLTVVAEDDDKRAEAFQILTRTAGDIDSIFPYVAVTSSAVADEGAPTSGEEFFDEYTMFKVQGALREGYDEHTTMDIIRLLQNAGILFRERVPTQPIHYGAKSGHFQPHSRACGFHAHDHGPACASDCPTCGGV
jgi:hypothetical protein